MSGADTPPDPQQLAAFLARLHALNSVSLRVRSLPGLPAAPDTPDDSLSETRLRAALALRAPPPVSRPALLHGDFWPGNTLWQTGQLSGVLDWEDAAHGDPLSDVGNARLELLFFHGLPAMRAFTAQYLALTGADPAPLPYWDLRAALRPCGRLHTWDLPPAQETQVRERHAVFTAQALRNLSGELTS